MVSLTEYAEHAQDRTTPSDAWFSQRPEIVKEIREALKANYALPRTTITRWLQEDHEFPFSRSTLISWLERQKQEWD